MKYLLCVPRGGFNDTLCQIAIAWKYADTFNRTLVINSYQSGLSDNFAKYFYTDRTNVIFDYNVKIHSILLSNQDKYPEFYQKNGLIYDNLKYKHTPPSCFFIMILLMATLRILI